MDTRNRASAALLLLLLVLPAFAHDTSGDFHGCPPEGDGGDERLNYLKNRDLPPPRYHRRTFDQVIGNVPVAKRKGKTRRIRWTNAELQSVYEWEARGASLVGYVAGRRRMAAEACNCHSSEHRDYHVWLVENPGEYYSDAVVVEISPRLLEAHPLWPDLLQRAKVEGDLVRISGWMMWDHEHGSHVGQSRATEWEIHPIHKIEVKRGNRWVEIADAYADEEE